MASDPTTEWDERQLCPDGSCIGVIGPDGTCKVCGRAAPGWGDERKRGLQPPPDEVATTTAGPSEAATESTANGDGEWEQRRLCSDGACIGVIEGDRCNVCGRPG